MLTIHNIDRIRNYTKVNVRVQEIDWAYVFWIDNGYPLNKVTLSRIHPPQINHPYKDYYCMTYEGQQMWVQRKDVLDCKKFLLTMTHFMANII
jgi:hypothetical protein